MRDIHFKHSLRASLLVLVRGKFSSRDGSSAAKIFPELAQGELAGTFTEKRQEQIQIGANTRTFLDCQLLKVSSSFLRT